MPCIYLPLWAGLSRETVTPVTPMLCQSKTLLISNLCTMREVVQWADRSRLFKLNVHKTSKTIWQCFQSFFFSDGIFLFFIIFNKLSKFLKEFWWNCTPWRSLTPLWAVLAEKAMVMWKWRMPFLPILQKSYSVACLFQCTENFNIKSLCSS